jgi:hypothetical protein
LSKKLLGNNQYTIKIPLKINKTLTTTSKIITNRVKEIKAKITTIMPEIRN